MFDALFSMIKASFGIDHLSDILKEISDLVELVDK